MLVGGGGGAFLATVAKNAYNWCYNEEKCFQFRMAGLQSMAQVKINLQRKQSLNQIIFSCDELSKQYIRLPKLANKFLHAREPRPVEEDRNDLLQLHLPKMQRFRLLNSINLDFTVQKPHLDKIRVKTEPFARHVNLTPQNRTAFRRIIQKYKRNFHPSNASRGLSNTSDGIPPKTSRKLRQLRGSGEDKEAAVEMKRIAILSQIINENNRRELKFRREKSRTRQREG